VPLQMNKIHARRLEYLSNRVNKTVFDEDLESSICGNHALCATRASSHVL
jgi:hypothetical protein